MSITISNSRNDAFCFLREAANCYNNTNDFSKASRCIEEAEKISPQDVHAIYRKVWELSGCPKTQEFGRKAFRPDSNVDPLLKGRAIHYIEKQLGVFGKPLNTYKSIRVSCWNLLSNLVDPFEFDGDYGSNINEYRKQVFDACMSKETIACNKGASNDEIAQATKADAEYGPTFGDLVPSIEDTLGTSHFSDEAKNRFKIFLEKNKDNHCFQLFRKDLGQLLSLEMVLIKNASKTFKELPILGSLVSLDGENEKELVGNLAKVLFSKEVIDLASNSDKAYKPKTQEELLLALEQSYTKLPQDLKDKFSIEDLNLLCTPEGVVFFYWMYQSLNLHLIADNNLIDKVNSIKKEFSTGIGNNQFKSLKSIESIDRFNPGVLFTQEASREIGEALSNKFSNPVSERDSDGCFIFLDSNDWQNPEVINLDNSFPAFREQRLNLVRATHKHTGAEFLLSSAHAKSTKGSNDCIEIVSNIKKTFDEMRSSHPKLQLIIGMDANTKGEESLTSFNGKLAQLGLQATEVGKTTIKRRMLTTQHSKAGLAVADEEDFIITLKGEGCSLSEQYTLSNGANYNPGIENPSDHFLINARLAFNQVNLKV